MNKDLQQVYDIFIKPYPNIVLEYNEIPHQYQDSRIIFGYLFDVEKECKMNVEIIVHELMHLLHSTKKQRYSSTNWGFGDQVIVDINKIYNNEIPVMRDTYTILNFILKDNNYSKFSYINFLTSTLQTSLDNIEANFNAQEFQCLLREALINQRDLNCILKEYEEVAKSI